MKCKLFIPKEDREIDYSIQDSVRVGDYLAVDGNDYTVMNILLDANQNQPVVFLK